MITVRLNKTLQVTCSAVSAQSKHLLNTRLSYYPSDLVTLPLKPTMAPRCLQASVCVPQWAHMPDPWLPVLGPGKAECSHHQRLASFMLGRPGQFSQVLELL